MFHIGAFPDILALLRGAGDDEDIRMECLYVLVNPWDPLVGADVPVAQALVRRQGLGGGQGAGGMACWGRGVRVS